MGRVLLGRFDEHTDLSVITLSDNPWGYGSWITTLARRARIANVGSRIHAERA